ncbi:hypothetical protein [Bacillus sp. SA1-12]|nr:hypothetical protein [Bacillus sp. SA1-12]
MKWKNAFMQLVPPFDSFTIQAPDLLFNEIGLNDPKKLQKKMVELVT